MSPLKQVHRRVGTLGHRIIRVGLPTRKSLQIGNSCQEWLSLTIVSGSSKNYE